MNPFQAKHLPGPAVAAMSSNVTSLLPALPVSPQDPPPRPVRDATSPLACLDRSQPSRPDGTFEVSLLDKGRLSLGVRRLRRIGWTARTPLQVHLDTDGWVRFRRATKPGAELERTRPHTDAKGRLVVDLGVRTWLGLDERDQVLFTVADDELRLTGVTALLTSAQTLPAAGTPGFQDARAHVA